MVVYIHHIMSFINIAIPVDNHICMDVVYMMKAAKQTMIQKIEKHTINNRFGNFFDELQQSQEILIHSVITAKHRWKPSTGSLLTYKFPWVALLHIYYRRENWEKIKERIPASPNVGKSHDSHRPICHIWISTYLITTQKINQNTSYVI